MFSESPSFRSLLPFHYELVDIVEDVPDVGAVASSCELQFDQPDGLAQEAIETRPKNRTRVKFHACSNTV
jgi:hypothetical protein